MELLLHATEDICQIRYVDVEIAVTEPEPVPDWTVLNSKSLAAAQDGYTNYHIKSNPLFIGIRHFMYFRGRRVIICIITPFSM